MIGLSITILVAGAIVASGFAMYRLVAGPTQADRVVALDILLAAAIALCIAAALATARTVFLDVAVGLALVAFVATIGWARLIEQAPRGRGTPGAPR
jgi:multicomponent Na+:H+ antiporter subunit F